MTIWMLAVTVGAVAIATVFAIVEVFWPLSVAAVVLLALLWWNGGATALLALWRPEIVAAYVAIGLCWLFFRWTRLVDEHLRGRLRGDKQYKEPPKWAEYSYDFSAYFFYWPFDAAGYVLSDLLHDAWKLIVKMVARSFDRYAEWRYKKATEGRGDAD